MRNDEFYIGWVQGAPASFVRFIRRYLLLVLLLVVVVGVLLAANQKKFSTASFEFGKATNVNGTYRSLPVPHLEVKDGSETVFVPLVGYGKHGAEGIVQELEKEQSTSLANKEVTLRGTLLYGDGKVLMQIDKNESPLVELSNENAPPRARTKRFGTTSLKGEIIDPKCYFGVMKPGEGKVHKDCAIRCIAGGIPPVLAIANEKGEKNYVLLVGGTGEKLNDKVKDFVAVPSIITGELMQVDNWLVMQVKEMKNELAAFSSDSSRQLMAACGSVCCNRMTQ
jgi:hypothetical protein